MTDANADYNEQFTSEPTTEARLRERIAELERERDALQRTLDKSAERFQKVLLNPARAERDAGLREVKMLREAARALTESSDISQAMSHSHWRHGGIHGTCHECEASSRVWNLIEALRAALDDARARKIKMPDYCHPATGKSFGGREDCDHDYPPESEDDRDDVVWWTCSKCGMRRGYEVID